MRRSFLTRPLGLLTALLYLALPGGVLASVACPHHDGLSALAVSDAGTEPQNAHGHAHAAAPASGESDSGDAPDCTTCTCIGACATSSMAVLGAAAIILAAPAAAAAPAVRPVQSEQPRPRLTPFQLPYAHAPPIQSIA